MQSLTNGVTLLATCRESLLWLQTNCVYHFILALADQAQESLGPFRPEVSLECPRECPRKGGASEGECPTGCLQGPSGPGLRGVQKVFRECPRSFLTLQGHSRDTFRTLRSPEPEVGPHRHPVGHSLGHPPFSGTLLGTLRGHFGPEGPKRLLCLVGEFPTFYSVKILFVIILAALACAFSVR